MWNNLWWGQKTFIGISVCKSNFTKQWVWGSEVFPIVWNEFNDYSDEIWAHHHTHIICFSVPLFHYTVQIKLDFTSAFRITQVLVSFLLKQLTGPHGVGINSWCRGLRFGDRRSGSSWGCPEIWLPNKGLQCKENNKLYKGAALTWMHCRTAETKRFIKATE